MISVKSSSYVQDKWIAFPGFLCSLYMLFNRPSVPLLVNKPGLEYYFAVVETNSPSENLSHCCKRKYPVLSGIHLGRYTIISAATQGKLNRKLNWLGLYKRSFSSDKLSNLKWVSAKFHWSGHGIINSMESPILLFDSSCVDNLVRDWCFAFISFLASGFLIMNILYNSFCLGKAKLKLCDLLED